MVGLKPQTVQMSAMAGSSLCTFVRVSGLNEGVSGLLHLLFKVS